MGYNNNSYRRGYSGRTKPDAGAAGVVKIALYPTDNSTLYTGRYGFMTLFLDMEDDGQGGTLHVHNRLDDKSTEHKLDPHAFGFTTEAGLGICVAGAIKTGNGSGSGSAAAMFALAAGADPTKKKSAGRGRPMYYVLPMPHDYDGD